MHKFLVKEDSNENIMLKEDFCSIVSIFNSKLEKEVFDNYLNRKKRFYKLLNDLLAENIHIEEPNEKKANIMKKEIVVSKVVKQMLNEFRNN